jgi:hypothetical protein
LSDATRSIVEGRVPRATPDNVAFLDNIGGSEYNALQVTLRPSGATG